MKTIISVFENTHDAHQMIATLRAHPLTFKDVSIIAKARDMHTHSTEDVTTSDGAMWGGLVGLAALALPGVGPFISGVALIDFSGISADEAIGYERAIRAGKTLVAIKAHDADAAELQRILMRRNPDQPHGDQASPATVPAWVMVYDEHGQRVDPGQVVDTASGSHGVDDDPATPAAQSIGAGRIRDATANNHPRVF